MTAPAFEWVPTVANSNGTATATVAAAKFGEGYQQRSASGLNNVASSFSLQWVGDETKIKSVYKFLKDRGGWQSFTWHPLLWEAPALFYCETWSEPTKDGRVFTITATFEQTFAP